MNEKQYTHLEINITHLLHNLRYFRSLLPPSTKLLVLAKAYAYGHGAGTFARILETYGVNYLAVAHPSEGVAIRKAGVKIPILVLSGCDAQFPLCLEYDLGPGIATVESFCHYVEQAKQAGKKDAPAHIKLDTGMHRLGFQSSQIPALLPHLDQPYVRIESVFTHLACATEPAFDNFTRSQIACYDAGCQQILSALPYRPLRHVLNSGGIERFGQEWAYDMVRLGIGLYGISAVDNRLLKPTAFLRTPVLQVKTIQQGETVGYSRQGKITEGPIESATLAVGYADGLNRHLGNGNLQVMLNGHLVPTIGNICMDMSMVNVSGLDVKAGDMATIFGENPTIGAIAEILNTIPYEILTSVNLRIPRVYKY